MMFGGGFLAIAKIQTGIRLLPEMYAKLQALAKQDNRSLNNYVEQILRKYVEDYEREHGEIPHTESST